MLALLGNEDARIRNALADNLGSLVKHVYPGQKRECGFYGNEDGVQMGFENADEVSAVKDSLSDVLIKRMADVISEMKEEIISVGKPCDINGETEVGNKLDESESDFDRLDGEIHDEENTVENFSVREKQGIAESFNEDLVEDISLVQKKGLVESCHESERSDERKTKDCETKDSDILGSNSSATYSEQISDNQLSDTSKADVYKIDDMKILNYEKLLYTCSEDLSNFKFLDEKLSTFWNGRRLDMFINMFHNILIDEIRSLGNSSHAPNSHRINGCIDLLTRLSQLFPLQEYKEIWLQSKYVAGSNSLVVILLEYLFTNSYSNIDLPSHSSIVNLLVSLLVSLDLSSIASENKINLSIVTSHLVKSLNITANVVGEANKLKTNTLKKNLEKISPIKSFTKEKAQTISSPKSLHLPVTSFLAQPILSHVSMNTEVLSPVKEEEVTSKQKPDLHEEFYSKLYDTVYNAHNNHRNNLRFDTDFGAFLENILENLCRLMTMVSHDDCKLMVGDLSSSLTAVLNVNPGLVIKCVYYTMKSVFNLQENGDNVDQTGILMTDDLVINAVQIDSPDKVSLAVSNSSPFDIFEPPSPKDKATDHRVKQQNTMHSTEQNSKTNRPCQKTATNSSSCKETKESISLYETCITSPLNRVQTLLEENFKILQNPVDIKSNKMKHTKSYHDFRRNFVIKKAKQHAVPPDAAMLSQYLRLFEPCIISLFKHYSETSNITLQVYVLKLLTYIVHLGFNYYNIDPELAFVQILLKQFDLFEHGYVKNAAVIIPNIVKFLLTLCAFGIEKIKTSASTALSSDKKKEAKLGSGSSLASAKLQDDTIISINKVIHMCDELYASGQDLQEHCIPGLKHIVKYIFIESHKSLRRESLIATRPGNVQDELDTQQEVLFINLLKLVHYHEVVFLLHQILCDNVNGDIHHRRSTSVCQILMGHIEHRTLSFDNFSQVTNILTLLDTLSPNVCEVDTLLGILFKFTDFNEENFVSSLASTIILVTSLFKLYSPDEMLDSIVRNKFASFSLDWNTEVDPLHVSITLDATTVEPQAELCKLLLYLLYHAVTSYTSLPKTSHSSFHSELVLNLILIFEHLLEKNAALKSNIARIIRDEKRKKNLFFCDLGNHLRSESSVVLSSHFTRLVVFLSGERDFIELQSDDHSLVENTMLQEGTEEELYKNVLDLLVFLDFHSKKIDENPTANPSDLNLLRTRFFQVVQLQHESPVHSVLIQNVKNSPNMSTKILDHISRNFDWTQSATYLSERFLSNFSRFMITYFNLDSFAEEILTLVGKHLVSVNHSIENKHLLRLLLSCTEHILVAKRFDILPSSDLDSFINPLLKYIYQCDMIESKERLRRLMSNLLDIRANILGNTCDVNSVDLENSTTNTEHWFVSNVRSLCCIPLLSTQSMDSKKDDKVPKETSWNSSGSWNNTFSSSTNIGELLKKLNESDLSAVLKDKQFNVKLLSSLVNTGKHLLLNKQECMLLELAVEKLFDVVKEFLKEFPESKRMYYPIHRFSDKNEVLFSKQMDSLFTQNDNYNTCLILMDVIEEFFRAIDELESLLDEGSEIPKLNKSVKARHSDVKDNQSINGTLSLTDSSHERSNDSQDYLDNVKKVLNKLKGISKQHANEMFKLFLGLFDFSSYLIENRELLFENHSSKLSTIVNKTIRTNSILMNKFSYIFNILLQENDVDLNNIVNCIYRIALLGKGDCFTITKHGNLNLLDSDNSTALFQLNAILQLIIRERESSKQAGKFEHLMKENPFILLNINELFNLTLSLCRCDKLYTYSRIPFHSWEYIDPVENVNELSLSTLPTEMLLNVTELNDFVLRLKYVGWHSRVHFEQTWVILLTILTEISNNNSEEEDEVIVDKLELYALTVRGITELLIQTQLIEPGNRQVDSWGEDRCEQSHSVLSHLSHYEGKFVHSSRSKQRHPTSDCETKAAKIQRILSQITQVTAKNVSIPSFPYSNYEFFEYMYNVNQLSYNYLHCALLDNDMNKDYICEDDTLVINEVSNRDYIDHMKQIKLLNLDIQSCLHLLIDIYSQLLNNGSLRADLVDSVLVLSDLFDNYQHYEWMYAKFSPNISEYPSDYSQAMHLICTTKSLCFIRIDQKREKLHGILRRIVSILNSTKSASEVLKVASMKCLFYLLEIYVEKYIVPPHDATGNNELGNISDKIKNSQLLNRTLDLIYNLIKTNTTWTQSVELENNFTSLCLFVLETFQTYTPHCSYTPFVETLHIIVDYLCARLAYYLNGNDATAKKLIAYIARIVTIYPKYQYLHRKLMNLFNGVIKKNKHYSVDFYTLYVMCVYNRYYTEKIPVENNILENILEDIVDSEVNPASNETLLDNATDVKNDSVESNDKDVDACDENVPELKEQQENSTETTGTKEEIIDEIVKDPLANQIVENFFSQDKSESKVDFTNENLDITTASTDPTNPLDMSKQDSTEDDDSFYKMITSKEKSNQIKNFISDTLQEKKEKFKQLIKVRTSFDPLSNVMENSTFYDKVVRDIDETDDIKTDRDEICTKKDSKLTNEADRKGKFISYVETDRESTTTEDSEKENARSSRQLSVRNTNSFISDSNRTINEDLSSIANYATDDSFAVIELISLFMSRIKQLNQDEMHLLSGKTSNDSSCNVESSASGGIYIDVSDGQKHDTETLKAIYREVDVLCQIIPCLFLDFGLESDMLNRVVSEFLTVTNQNFTRLKNNDLLSPRTTCGKKYKTSATSSSECPIPLELSPRLEVSFENLHVQSKLSSILLHVLKHNQLDLINDWIVSTLSNLFDHRSFQLTSYYLYIFLCFSCKHELIRDFFVNHREINFSTLKIIVRTFYDQLNVELKRKFVEELESLSEKMTRVDGEKWMGRSGDTCDDFRDLFEHIFSCLNVDRDVAIVR